MPDDMSFADHLEELRRRIIISVLAVIAAAAASFFFADFILRLLLAPSGGLKLRGFSILDGFLIKLRLALYAGLVAASPVWIYQVIRFVSPGMYPTERRSAFLFLAGALVLFAAGTVFGYTLLGSMIRVLVRMFPAEIEYLPSAGDYISFVLFFLIACGLAFQLPSVLAVLVRLQVLSADTLRRKRRIGYFALFVFAEIITPVTDPIVAPLMVMLPLVGLYEISILVARRIEAKRITTRLAE